MERQKQAYLYTAVVICFWATVASAFKISLRYLDYLQLLLGASVASILVLFIILTVQGKLGLLRKNSGKDYLNSLLLGFLNPFLYYAILFKAYSLLPAQEAQPLNQTWAIVMALLSIVLLKQRITLKSVVALLISFLGVLTISTHGKILTIHFSSLPGVGLALGSAFIWALFWIYNVKDGRDEVVKLFLNFLFGLPFILVFTWRFSSITIADSRGLLGAIYVGVFEMGITFVLWLKALKLSRTTVQVGILIYLVPFLSLICINLFVGERILLSTVTGLALIVAGILLQQHGGTPAHEAGIGKRT